MMEILKITGIYILSYLIGSIPFSQIITSIVRPGTDLRTIGSANCGATNVFMKIGALPGLLTLIFDMSKGIFVLFLARLLMNWHFSTDAGWLLATTCFVILGHDYPLWNKFKGGKGLALMEAYIIFFGPVWGLLVHIPQAHLLFQKDAQHALAISNFLMLITFPMMSICWYIGSTINVGWLGWNFTHLIGDPITDSSILAIFSLIWTLMFFVQRVLDNPGIKGMKNDIKKGIPLRKVIFLRGLYGVFPAESDYRHPDHERPMGEEVLKRNR